MNYRQLLASYIVELFDTSQPRQWRAYDLNSGWRWWSQRSFDREGCVVCRATGQRRRLTSHREGNVRIYSVGAEVSR